MIGVRPTLYSTATRKSVIFKSDGLEDRLSLFAISAITFSTRANIKVPSATPPMGALFRKLRNPVVVAGSSISSRIAAASLFLVL